MAKTNILDEAIGHLEHATRMSPRNARYHALLGEGYLLRGECEDAVAPLQMSFQEDALPRTAYLLAVSLLRIGNHREAESYATVALEEGNAFHRSYHVRSRARLAQGDREGAINDLWYALDLVPGDETYRLELGRLLVERAFRAKASDRRRRLVEARDVLMLRESTARFEPERLYLAGCCLLELGDADAALEQLDRTDFPGEEELALRRGLALAEKGQVDEAREHLETARNDAALAPEVERLTRQLDDLARGTSTRPMALAPSTDSTLFEAITFASTGPRVESGPVVPAAVEELLWAEDQQAFPQDTDSIPPLGSAELEDDFGSLTPTSVETTSLPLPSLDEMSRSSGSESDDASRIEDDPESAEEVAASTTVAEEVVSAPQIDLSSDEPEPAEEPEAELESEPELDPEADVVARDEPMPPGFVEQVLEVEVERQAAAEPVAEDEPVVSEAPVIEASPSASDTHSFPVIDERPESAGSAPPPAPPEAETPEPADDLLEEPGQPASGSRVQEADVDDDLDLDHPPPGPFSRGSELRPPPTESARGQESFPVEDSDLDALDEDAAREDPYR